jgi:hypothetical protein
MNTKRSSLLSFTEFVVCVALGGCVLSLLTPRFPIAVFSPTFSVLWLLWILCALKRNTYQRAFELIRLWVAIDLGALVMLLSISLSTGDITRGQGSDAIVALIYLPVLLPTGFIVALLPDNNPLFAIDTLLRGPLLSAFGVWLHVSLIATLQSVGIYYLGRLLTNHSNRSRVKHAPI